MSTLMYDGVQTHGALHRSRMAGVAQRRHDIMLQAVVVIATALVRQENQDAVSKQLRRLQDLLLPQDPEKKAQREAQMKDLLRREGAKSYSVEVVKLGERGE